MICDRQSCHLFLCRSFVLYTPDSEDAIVFFTGPHAPCRLDARKSLIHAFFPIKVGNPASSGALAFRPKSIGIGRKEFAHFDALLMKADTPFMKYQKRLSQQRSLVVGAGVLADRPV